MTTRTHRMLRHEAELLTRFADAYRGRFTQMIDQLNHTPSAAQGEQCMRLCVETLSMLLSTQTHLAEALARMDDKIAA